MAYHFFTEPQKLQTQVQNIAFGAIDENQYRLSNLYTATVSPKVFAVSNGSILVQECVDNSTLVNLIIKPTEQPDLDLPKIDFIIYKGVMRNSIIESTGIIAPELNNDLTKKIWESYRLQVAAFANNSNTTPPLTPLAKDVLGFGYNSTGIGEYLALDTDSLNKVFYSDINPLFTVVGGDYIGDFGIANFGIMILFERIGFKPTFKFARETDTKLLFPPILPEATSTEIFKRKHDKEIILSFIDTSAFFGAFHSLGIKTYNGTVFETKFGQSLYDTVTVKNFNKNKVYIDIKNEYDDSFNYYENYSNNISWSLDNTEALSPVNYYRSTWPILVVDNNEVAITNTEKIIKISLPNHDNESPLIYLKRAYRADIGLNRLPQEREKFLTPTSVGATALTRLVRLNQNVIIPHLSNFIISNYFQIKYIKRVKVDDDQETGPSSGVDINIPSIGHSLYKRTYLDNIFPIFDMEIPFPNIGTNLKVFYDASYIDKILVKDIPQRDIIGNYTLRDYTANIGIASDTNAITFISFPYKYNSNINRNNSIIPLSGMEMAGNNPFLIELNDRIAAIDLQRDTFIYNNNTIEYVKVVNNIIPQEIAFTPTNYNFDDVIIISITRTQFEALKVLKTQNFTEGYKVYLGVKNITSINSNEKSYVSFQLVLRGLRHLNNQIDAHSVDTNITLYTDEQILGISSGHAFPVSKAYIEEGFGERTNGQHKGIDIETTTNAGTAGQPIYAARAGVVDKIIKLNDLLHHGGVDDNLGGIRVRILGDNGFYYNYFHMQPNSNNAFNIGTNVAKGTQIGTIGISGFGYGVNPNWSQYHLHFEVWQSVTPLVKISPYRVFPELALLPFDNHRGQ